MLVVRRWSTPLFGEAWGELPKTQNGHNQTKAPAIDLVEHAGHFTLCADMPGLSESDIDLTLEKGVLMLSGARKNEAEGDVDATGKALYSERQSPRYFRQVPLSDEIDVTGVEATYRQGVLEVTLPKREQVAPRTIPVKVS